MRDWPCDPQVFGKIAYAHAESDNPELAEKLAEAIEALPEHLAVLVNAVIWERISKRALARQLNLHRPEIDRRLAQAFEMIREHMGWTRDAYFEVKKAEGLLTGVDEYLTKDEQRATVIGRSRGDGRRMDAFCSDDPVEWEGAA